MKFIYFLLIFPFFLSQTVSAEAKIPVRVEKFMRLQIDRICVGKGSEYELYDYEVIVDEGTKIHSVLMQSADFDYEGDQQYINVIELNDGKFELHEIECVKDYDKIDS